jgi:alpha-glucosidase
MPTLAVIKKLLLSLLLIVLCLPQPTEAAGGVIRKKFTTPFAYLLVEVLDDDLVHFEVAAGGSGPALDQPLYTSPMVFKTEYTGPTSFVDNGTVLETRDISLEVNPTNLCVAVTDKTKPAYLTTLCPHNLNQPWKGLNIDPGAVEHVYGLGQQFIRPGSADGDWLRHGVRQGLDFGNGFQGFQNAAVGNVQIPVMYAVGDNNLNYAIFMDNVYKQRWDFTAFWWQARMFGDQLRFYVMTGPDLLDLRRDYMELVGKPPVPPRKSFGLWVSEFGYDNWDQIEVLRAGLRSNGFPIEGFVLDLNWFGGIDLNDSLKSKMGRLNWDEQNNDGNPYFFPNPGQQIQALAADQIGLTAIEESYLANSTDTFAQMPADFSTYGRTNNQCDEANQSNPVTDVSGFWGQGRMIDWSDPAAGAWFHNQRRYPNLSQKGITAHWTDLGEPESFTPGACYEGVESTATGLKNQHADIHNLYNLLWNQSIWEGYWAKRGQPNDLGQINPRPFIVTRSGTAGTQRYGAAMWSGDIAGNLESLATHANAQMHMSFSGIDYYGADIGGFRREVMPYNNKNGIYRGYEQELYTQWFADGAWFDIPVRPHTDNEFVKVNPPYATSPHLVGKEDSNLANIRQRYELTPFYYSLAYRAYLYGEPIVSPLVLYHQNDPNVREMGHEKLIGRDLLVGLVAHHGEYERAVYLPAGQWINYHSNEWFASSGQWLERVPVYRDGILRLPVFARAGAIIPHMYVDEHTKDVFGRPQNNALAHPELMVQVYADPALSSFTLYEDDGQALDYDPAGRPIYHYRTTELSQQQVGNTVTVTIQAAVEVNPPFTGAVIERANVVKLVVQEAEASAVSLNGTALPQHTSASAFNAASSGWYNAGRNLILAKSEVLNVYNTTKTFSFNLQPITPATSVNFVCDRGFTAPGQSVYMVGSLPELGAWDPQQAIKLEPNIYYEYVWNPPAGHNGPGPAAPVWTRVISGLPAATTFEWKCLRRGEDGAGQVQWQPGQNNSHTTGPAGYAGRSYGSF